MCLYLFSYYIQYVIMNNKQAYVGLRAHSKQLREKT